MAITSLYVKMFSQGPEEQVNSIFRESQGYLSLPLDWKIFLCVSYYSFTVF